MASDASRRTAALADAAVRIAGSTTTGRLGIEALLTAFGELIEPPARERLREVLERAPAGPPPLSGTAVQRALADAWDAEPLDELDSLEESPVAVTPGAQVHRAVLDGTPVAVKLLRPGLAGRVRQDLALLEALVVPLASVLPALDASGLLREARERILDELDLEHEAGAQRRFHRALRGHPLLHVPAPVTRLAGESVAVSEWVEGTPLLEAADRDGAAARLVLFTVGAARRGLVYGDPEPANFIVLEDGRLAVVDFGASAQIAAERVDGLLAGVEAFSAGDGAALGTALETLGVVPASQGQTVLEVARDALGELGGQAPSRLDRDALWALGERLAGHRETGARLAGDARFTPSDLWPLRGLGQTFLTVARLGARGGWRELVARALRDGWDAELD